MANSPPPPPYQSQPSHPYSNRVIPYPVNQSLPTHQPYPNTILPIQREQPNSARMALPPPSDYLVWSIANTACSVLFSIWA